METEKKLKEDLLKREANVKIYLDKYSEIERSEFEVRVRAYKFSHNKIRMHKLFLIDIDSQLSKNQNSLLTNLITGEFYRSTQDYIKKLNLENKIEFYEFEKIKIGASYVQYEKEFDAIDFSDPHYEDIDDELKERNNLIISLYEQSLRWTILKQMGLKV
jgi:hypothetical protein